MKLQITKNFFLSLWFFLKHIILFILVNSFCAYFFMNFLFNLLMDILSVKIDTFFSSNIFTSERIIGLTLITFTLIVKLGFYVIALNNDKEEIENDITLYFYDFIDSLFYLSTSFYVFLFLGLFISVLVLPGILFFTFCSFFPIFAVVRKTIEGKRYNQIETISKSFKLTKTKRLKLLFFNNIVIIACVVAYCFFSGFFQEYFYNYLGIVAPEIVLGGFTMNRVIATFFIDFILVFTLNTGFNLEKVEAERIAKIEEEELQAKMQEQLKPADV